MTSHSLLLLVALQLTVLFVVSMLFGLLISRIQKLEPRATVRNIVAASLFSLLVYCCVWLFFFAPIVGLTTGIILLVAVALYIIASRPTWSQIAADCLATIALLALVLGVVGG